MTAEALPLPDGPSAEVRFVSPYPEVTRQVADALRWFFAFDEDSSYRAGPKATDLRLRLPLAPSYSSRS
jgi:hypothetical protein